MKYYLIWSDYDHQCEIEEFEGKEALEKRYGELMLIRQSNNDYGTVINAVIYGRGVALSSKEVITIWQVIE